MMGRCNGCGDCCEVIPLPFEKTQRLRAGKTNNLLDLKWFRGLTLVPTEEAVPRLRALGKPFDQSSSYFDCPHFERETRSCRIHESPDYPPVCANYPLYDEPVNASAIPVRCGYVEDAPTFIQFIPMRPSLSPHK